MFERTEDTIVAISSPAGVGVRGLVRLSGPDAIAMAAGEFAAHDDISLTDCPGHARKLGRVTIGDGAGVPAEAYVFRGPASYTRQDVVELHTIGSPPVLAMVLERLTGAGARPAEPGEFTARAFLSGAMDLTRVEGVAAIIHACNDSQLRASEALLHGRLSQRSMILRERLADLLALIEAEIDFTEEPIDFISPNAIRTEVLDILEALRAIINHAPSVERFEVLPEVLLIGWPNGGKSTLFNRLTGTDRAIRSATARTTRDLLRAPMSVPGGEVVLCDTAGLATLRRDEVVPAVDAMAEQAVRQAVASAALVLVVIDVTDEPDRAWCSLRDLVAGRRCCVVGNKIDLVDEQDPLGDVAPWMTDRITTVSVSGQDGIGIDALRSEIGGALFSEAEIGGGESLALSHRQRQALCDARDALQRARQLCRGLDDVSTCAELLALEIREAAHALSLLIGDVTTEELLGRVFSRFCIGK